MNLNYIRDNLIVFCGRIGSLAFTFALNWMAARLLIPEQAGTFFLSISVIWMLSLIIQMGANYSFNFYLPNFLSSQDHLGISRIIRSSFSISAILFVGVAILALIFYRPFFEHFHYASYLFALWLVGAAAQGLLAECLRGLYKTQQATYLTGVLAQVIGLVVIGAISLFIHPTLIVFIVGMIAGTWIACLLGLFWLRQTVIGYWQKTHSVRWTEFLRHNFSYFLVNIAIYLFSQLDLWMASWLAGHDKVAVYAIAQRMSLLTTLPAAVINQALMPHFSRLKAQSDEVQLKQLYRQSIFYSFTPALILLSIYCLGGEWILSHVFGSTYAAGSSILIIMTLGYAVHFLPGSVGTLLLMSGKETYVLGSVIFSLAVSFGFQYFLYPQFGLAGLAAGSAIGLAVQTMGFLVAFYKTSNFFIPRVILNS